MCPKATAATNKTRRLSPHDERGEGDEDSESGEFGVAIGIKRMSRSFRAPGTTFYSSAVNGDVPSDDETQARCGEEHLYLEEFAGKYYETVNYQRSEAPGWVEYDNADFELTDIVEYLGDALACEFDESESSVGRYLGVMRDGEFDLTAAPQAKRGLCHDTLGVFYTDDGRRNDKQKRAKRIIMTELTPVQTSLFSTLSLGSPAFQNSISTLFSQQFRGESPALLSSDDEDLDRQLGEELDIQNQGFGDGDETPVPLLTPPGSPLTVEWEGRTTTLCEWPSNLVVDSAMQAANELRPMSPNSLENCERDEQVRVDAMAAGYGDAASSLTPLLRSICVGNMLLCRENGAEVQSILYSN